MNIPKDASVHIMKAGCKDEAGGHKCDDCKMLPECNENKYKDGLAQTLPLIIAEIGIDREVFFANLDLDIFDVKAGKIMVLTFENQVIANLVGEAVFDSAGKIIGLKMESVVKRPMVEQIQRKYNITPPVRMPEPEVRDRKEKQKLYPMPSNATIQ